MTYFSRHAEDKFSILARHGIEISREAVVKAIESPDVLDRVSRYPLIIAQSELDEERVLRVVYRQEGIQKIVITFYPGRKSQYG